MYKRIKELRLENGWTQKEVAAKLGCFVDTYGRYERGEAPIPLVVMVHLSYLYDVSFQYMVDMTDIRTRYDFCSFEEWCEAMNLK